MADLKTALDNFLASEDFKAGVISSTKAGWGGSGYSVELFEDGTYRVSWDNQIGNLYVSPGVILGLPKINDEYLEEIEGWTEEEIQDNAFNLGIDDYEQDLRRELDFILEQREEAAKQNWGGKREGAGRPKKLLSREEALDMLADIFDRSEITGYAVQEAWDNHLKKIASQFSE